ncbi:MAG TPA: hypothetical protein VJB57_03510 [Dehalococcoidia bacterium]|nr:hypothetical protein [Dehalococcoidia bacterium]
MVKARESEDAVWTSAEEAVAASQLVLAPAAEKSLSVSDSEDL